MKLLYIPIFILIFSFTIDAQNKQEYDFVKYYFVELISNPDKPQVDSTKVAEIQARHMENMRSMADNGKLVCAGPFSDEKGGGIWILSVDSYSEAEKLCKQDPAIINERLTYKIRPWITSEGTFTLENKN